MSDHSCDHKGTRDDIQTGGGEVARGQITVVTAKGGGTTYSLDVEQESKWSDHSQDYNKCHNIPSRAIAIRSTEGFRFNCGYWAHLRNICTGN